MRKIPMRTCVICREKTNKRDLFRIVRDEKGNVVFDRSGKQNGRGAYICGKEECIKELAKAKRINNALETNVTPMDMEKVVNLIKKEIENKGEGK